MMFHFSYLCRQQAKPNYSLHLCCLFFLLQCAFPIGGQSTPTPYSPGPGGSNQKADNSQQHTAPASETPLSRCGGKNPQDPFFDAPLNYCLTCHTLKFLMTTTYCTGSAPNAKSNSFRVMGND